MIARPLAAATLLVLALASTSACLEGDPNPLAEQSQGSSGIGTSDQPSPSPTAEPSTACSQNSTQPVNLPFRNAFTDRSVRLFWVDYSCNEVAYKVLAPGQTHVQQTYVGHPWRVRDASTNALYKELVPTTAPPEVVVP